MLKNADIKNNAFIVLLVEQMTAYTIGGTALIMARMYLAQGGYLEKPEGPTPSRDDGAGPARGE